MLLLGLSLLIAAAVVVAEEPSSASAATGCTYPRLAPYQLPTPFYGRAQDGDNIGILDMRALHAPQPGRVTIRLEAGPNVTWWKELAIYDCRGNRLAQDYTQNGQHTTVWFSFATSDIAGGSIVLSKAKLFGIHTVIYQMPQLEKADGQSWEVYWGSD